MNSSEQTTVATLAVFFALIFLLIMVTMCCILRRGCRKETTQEGHKRYRFRADWDKSGTITSSETRITEAVPGMNDNSQQTPGPSERGATGTLLRIEEDTAGESSHSVARIKEKNDNSTTDYEQISTIKDGQKALKNPTVELSESDESRMLISKETTQCSISTELKYHLSNDSRDDGPHADDVEISSNCSGGENLKESIMKA